MSEITHKIIIMFVIMMVGVLCGKAKLITPEANKKLADVLLFLVSPMITFLSYQREYSSAVAVNLLIALLLAIVTYAVMIGISNLIIGKKSRDREVEILCAVFSNCAFMGIPIVESVFGADGIIFLTMYITVFHLLSWTYGISLLTGERSAKDTLRHLMTPAVISVFLGLIFFFCRIPLPQFIREPFQLIGDMNTPLAMLVAGATLSGTSLKELFSRPRILYISALRLLLFPAITALLAAGLVKLGADPMS
ncbi:MAG: AEC family transporter, partial [Clostridia bacterium]|nr:AEC family transporter [Clostridia bacterium]